MVGGVRETCYKYTGDFFRIRRKIGGIFIYMYNYRNAVLNVFFSTLHHPPTNYSISTIEGGGNEPGEGGDEQRTKIV